MFCLWNSFKDNLEMINSLVLFFTLLVIIYYTYETYRLRVSSEKNVDFIRQQLEIEKQKNEPNIVAYFDNGANFQSIVLVLSNEGGSQAKDVKLKIDPALNLGDSTFQKYFYNNALFKDGVIIQARSKYIIKVGYTTKASPLYKEDKIPPKYKVDISFSNLSGNSFTKQYELPIDQFFYRIDPGNKTEIETQLEEINNNLKNIASTISKSPEGQDEVE